MIKLHDIIKEFNYGSKLFDDPNQFRPRAKDNMEFMSFWKKFLQGEPNTSSEISLLNALKAWTADPPDDQWLNGRIDDLKFLLTLKNQYSEILDPTKSKFRHPKYAFRVATIPMSTAVKALKTLSLEELRSAYTNSIPIDIDMPMTLKSRSKRGYYSFTVNYGVTLELAGHAQIGAAKYDQIYYYRRIPAIIKVDINSPKLLFNPDFFKGISEYEDEAETLYIDSQIDVKGIVLPTGFIDEILSGGERYSPGEPKIKYRDSLMQQFPNDPDILALYKILDSIRPE